MTPVRKNTTDLEQGLLELAELSQHVQQEMSGQRETLEELLDSMKTTIRIEVPNKSVSVLHPLLIIGLTGHTRPAGRG